ncbi:MAG: hypothetical protein FJZ38_15630 [Candidatus Rokubacteria bacterium]|nr:hypothetical protein [Candidatus Rokubacteria bacterium]
MEPDEQRDARAVHDAAHQVAPELVGAEPVLAARARELLPVVRAVGVVRREQLGRPGHDQHREDDEAARRAERLGADELADDLDEGELRRERRGRFGVGQLDVRGHRQRYRIRGSNHA